MMALPPYASAIERLWRVVFILLCASVLLFLISPILAIMPLELQCRALFHLSDARPVDEVVCRLLPGSALVECGEGERLHCCVHDRPVDDLRHPRGAWPQPQPTSRTVP